MKHASRLVTICLILVVVLNLIILPRTTAAAAKGPATRSTTRADVLAKQLVKKLSGARSSAARQKALLDIMKALHIGVYASKTGKAIVRGAETSDKDFYQYDYELTLLSGALERKEMRSMSDIAYTLTAAGIKPNGQPVDPDFLRRALIASVQGAAAHPTRQTMIVPLVIRELGLRHDQPYDLTQDVPQDRLSLDALQALIFTADILAPIARKAATASNVMHAQLYQPHTCKALNIATSPFNPNTWLDFFGQHVDYVTDAALSSQIGDFVAALNKAGAEVGAINMAFTVLTGLHGMLLAYSIKIDSLPDLRPVTHYGPAGDGDVAEAGKPIVFRALVTMQDDLGGQVVACLNAAGFSIPSKGPVKGVPVDWHQNTDDLEKYGTISYQPADQKTGDDGIASMIFTPKNELNPGFGTLITKHGGVEPRALWGMAFENLLGTINEVITPKLGPEFSWTVSYHRPRGYKFSHLRFNLNYNYSGNLVLNDYTRSEADNYEYFGRICGEDPYYDTNGHIWFQVHQYLHAHRINGFGQVEDKDYSDDQSWELMRNGKSISGLPGNKSTTSVSLDLKNRQITIHIGDTGGPDYTPHEITATATLEEDTSCPDNS